MPAPLAAPNPPRQRPDDEVHFAGMPVTPSHHYILWFVLLLALAGAIWFAWARRSVPTAAPDAMAPMKPKALAIGFVARSETGIVIRNEMVLPLADAKVTAKTASGNAFVHRIGRLEGGAELPLAPKDFRDRNGWSLDPSLAPPVTISVECFGLSIEKPWPGAEVAPTP